MAAGIVYHNITTAAGVTFSLACWVPDTASPNVGAIPVSMPIKSDGTADILVPPIQVNGNGASVEFVSTITASSYAAGYVMGGVMQFANALPASFNGRLQSITLKFKGSLQTGEFDVSLFTSLPTSTFTDRTTPAIVAADSAILTGIYPMTQPNSQLGTHTLYNYDAIGKEIVGSTTSLYAVVTTKSIPVNPASTADMSLKIGIAW